MHWATEEGTIGGGGNGGGVGGGPDGGGGIDGGGEGGGGEGGGEGSGGEGGGGEGGGGDGGGNGDGSEGGDEGGSTMQLHANTLPGSTGSTRKVTSARSVKSPAVNPPVVCNLRLVTGVDDDAVAVATQAW